MTEPDIQVCRTLLAATVLLAASIVPRSTETAEPNWVARFQYRLFLLQNTALASDAELTSAKEQLRLAAITGYNGVVLAATANLVQPQLAGEEYRARLAAIGEEAGRLQLGLIPSVMPFDRGDLAIPSDPHMAEGIPIRDVLYVVRGGEAFLQPDPPVALADPGFELPVGGAGSGWQAADAGPHRLVGVDTSQALHGNSSLCLSNEAQPKTSLTYSVRQTVRIPAFRLFRVRIAFKPKDAGDAETLFLAAYQGGRYLTAIRYAQPAGPGRWHRHGLVFGSFRGGDTEIRIGIYEGQGKAHRIWVDEVGFEELGATNILRRPGCPVVVRNERGRAYTEGHDYKFIGAEAPRWQAATGFEASDEPVRIIIPPKSTIRNGERLRVSYYSPFCHFARLAPLCLNYDRVYDFFLSGIGPLKKALAPVAYHLATEYIATANWDQVCVGTKKTPGGQWGDSLKRQIKILSQDSVPPLCFVRSEMYESWNNPYKDYCVCNGTFEDAVRYLPNNVIVINANYAREEAKSPRFFASAGYRQVIAGATGVGEWMQANAEMPGIVGVMNIDAPLDQFAANAWGWLPAETRTGLPRLFRESPGTAPSNRHRASNPTSRPVTAPPKATTPSASFRTWTDRSGQYRIEAEFIGIASGTVSLRNREGREITVPYETLSDEDRQRVRRETARR